MFQGTLQAALLVIAAFFLSFLLSPWTVAFPLTRMPDYGMFEYACHEGNHGLLNALSGSRAEERAARTGN